MADLGSNFASTLSFSVLSSAEIGQIHQAALDVLANTGVEVQEPEALELLRNAGAKCEGKMAKIPANLVEKALETAPKSIPLYRRDGSPGIVLEGRKAYYGTGSDCPKILDSRTGEVRMFTKSDVSEAAKLCDALANIDFFMSLGIAQDITPALSDVHQFAAMIENTEKPIVFTAHDRAGMDVIIKIADAFQGGVGNISERPSICLYAEPITPLKHIDIAMKKMLLAAERKIPVVYTPCPMAGGTTPATLAGTLVVSITEILSGLVIHQLKNPGAPFIMGGVLTILDMSTFNFSYGCPEFDLMEAALADIHNHYGIPMFGTAGCTDSKLLDQQAAIEATFSALMMGLAGANLVHDVGYIEYGLTGCYEMIAMTDEIVGMVRRVQRGIKINSDTLAVDVINRVGPGGNFLADDHTLEHFRQETWYPKLLDRNNRQAWEANGSKTLGQRLNEKVLHILNDYQPSPVSEEVAAKIAALLADREKKVQDEDAA